MNELQTLKSIRRWVYLFIICIIVSGATALPLQTELKLLRDFVCKNNLFAGSLQNWILRVNEGIETTYLNFPFMGYGTDWLAFGHFVIALFFIGPVQDPVKNEWVIKAGMIACIMVIPFAFIAGTIREIPVTWRLIDCSFGGIGLLLLKLVLRKIHSLKIKIFTQQTA